MNNSAEYWSTEEAPSTRGWFGLRKSSWVILADAAGTTIGTAAAGAGSIILGAAWSIVMNESNQNEISAEDGSSDNELIKPGDGYIDPEEEYINLGEV